MPLTFWYQILRGLLRMKSALSSAPSTASNVHFTSFAVNGLPSCHVTPGCSLNVGLVLLSSHDQLSARSGTSLSALFTFSWGSNTTRLLNTAMKGWFTEIVVSSWIEALGGFSRWEICSVPPAFWASAGVAATPKATRLAATKARRLRTIVLPDRGAFWRPFADPVKRS